MLSPNDWVSATKARLAASSQIPNGPDPITARQAGNQSRTRTATSHRHPSAQLDEARTHAWDSDTKLHMFRHADAVVDDDRVDH